MCTYWDTYEEGVRMTNRNNNGSFVVISDFHACNWPIEKIEKYYLQEYQTIYILGDATDRGETQNGAGGVQLLLKIKELTERYPGRVVYLPGNHDAFFYDYAASQDMFASENMRINHGTETIKDIDRLRYSNPRQLQSVVNWLGNLPLQREHFYEGKRYVLAHALFNENLFRANPNFNLNDYNRYGSHYGVYAPILWFRKNQDNYNRNDLPRGNSIMIVGHTPESSRKGINLDLTNAYNETVKVFCVDGGIAGGNAMLKFDGGNEVHRTVRYSHRKTAKETPKTNHPSNTPQKPTGNRSYIQSNKEAISSNQVIRLIETSPTSEEALLKLFKISVGVRESDYAEIFDILRSPEMREYMSEQMLYYATKSIDAKNPQNNTFQATKELINKIALDHIIRSLITKYHDIRQAANNVYGYFLEHDLDYITESVGHARSIARKFDPKELERVIVNSNHPKIIDYIKYEYGSAYRK